MQYRVPRNLVKGNPQWEISLRCKTSPHKIAFSSAFTRWILANRVRVHKLTVDIDIASYPSGRQGYSRLPAELGLVAPSIATDDKVIIDCNQVSGERICCKHIRVISPFSLHCIDIFLCQFPVLRSLEVYDIPFEHDVVLSMCNTVSRTAHTIEKYAFFFISTSADVCFDRMNLVDIILFGWIFAVRKRGREPMLDIDVSSRENFDSIFPLISSHRSLPGINIKSISTLR